MSKLEEEEIFDIAGDNGTLAILDDGTRTVIFNREQLLAFAREIEKRTLIKIASRVRLLRDSHIVDAEETEDEGRCDFAIAWDDVLQIIAEEYKENKELREAIELAEEALRSCSVCPGGDGDYWWFAEDMVEAAITAIEDLKNAKAI